MLFENDSREFTKIWNKTTTDEVLQVMTQDEFLFALARYKTKNENCQQVTIGTFCNYGTLGFINEVLKMGFLKWCSENGPPKLPSLWPPKRPLL